MAYWNMVFKCHLLTKNFLECCMQYNKVTIFSMLLTNFPFPFHDFVVGLVWLLKFQILIEIDYCLFIFFFRKRGYEVIL
jgi:hypothetical protein